MNIPILNIYYLLLYAWDALEEGDVVNVGELHSTRLQDLFARVLIAGVDHVLRRGLDRGYIPEQQQISGLRGRLDLGATLRTRALWHRQTVCEADDLTTDILANRILATTLDNLARADGLDPMLRTAALEARRKLSGVGDVRLSHRAFHSAQLHRNNRYYRFLMDVCQLVYDNLLVEEKSGAVVFRDFLRDDAQMATLFERFVRNFFRKERPDLKARSEHLAWQQVTGTVNDLAYLPQMRTDVSLGAPGRLVIVDTKFYREALQTYRGAPRVRSDHLYQLLAYLQNAADRAGPALAVSGVLLYPTVDKTFDLRYRLRGHAVRVCTLDLNRPWKEIHQALLSLGP
jgi:5-methylcytosine-specific restriction enzyme subunit McrC